VEIYRPGIVVYFPFFVFPVSVWGSLRLYYVLFGRHSLRVWRYLAMVWYLSQDFIVHIFKGVRTRAQGGSSSENEAASVVW
jgi:hypothetical protein